MTRTIFDRNRDDTEQVANFLENERNAAHYLADLNAGSPPDEILTAFEIDRGLRITIQGVAYRPNDDNGAWYEYDDPDMNGTVGRTYVPMNADGSADRSGLAEIAEAYRPDALPFDRCPVLVQRDGATVSCDEPLEASVTAWMRDVRVRIDPKTGEMTVTSWGEDWDRADLGEDGTRVYCADDHDMATMIAAVENVKEGSR